MDAVAVDGHIHVDAQWPSYPWKNVPRTKDGKIDMNAPPPRTADGHPDLSGFWMPGATIRDQVKWLLNFAADMKSEEIPLQPWARQLYNERIENNGKDHPGVRCWPSGIPEKLTIPDGLKLVHTRDVMLFLHESRTIYRQVFTDGRPLPTPEQAQPMWMGYSIGHWEGDDLRRDDRHAERQDVAGHARPSWNRGAEGDRTLHASDDGPHEHQGHD